MQQSACLHHFPVIWTVKYILFKTSIVGYHLLELFSRVRMKKEVDYWVDIHDKDDNVADQYKSFGSKKERMKIMEGTPL